MDLRRVFVAVACCALATLLIASPASGGDRRGGMGDDHGHGDGHDMGDDHGHGDGREGGGHDRTSPTVPGARVIRVRAKSYVFSPRQLTLRAGEDVTIALRSTDILHDFVVKRGGHIVAAKAGTTKRGGLRIDTPGTYRFWCSVEGHRAAGMEGTIVVE